MPFKYPDLRARLLANSVEQPGPLATPCRVWTGAVDGAGYPKCSIRDPDSGKVRHEGAHRLGATVFNGVNWNRRRTNTYALHDCDNKLCIVHARPGTQAENMAHRTERGRVRRYSDQRLARLLSSWTWGQEVTVGATAE